LLSSRKFEIKTKYYLFIAQSKGGGENTPQIMPDIIKGNVSSVCILTLLANKLKALNKYNMEH